MPAFNLAPALTVGLAIGIYEAVIIHRDVTLKKHRFFHIIHAIVLSMIFVFCTSNAKLILDLFPILKGVFFLGKPFGFQLLIGIISAIKIHYVSRVSKGYQNAPGAKETWFHSILVGALVIAAPYVYPLIEPLIPRFS